ncbi:MAG TPA: DNA translocase FtsK [Clostridiaceae bacterium]|nr:DNA translocase FtsK [Clostridiaceae bacterium]
MASKGAQKKKYRIKKKKNRNSSGNNNEIIGILILALGIMVLLSIYVKGSMGLFGTLVRNLFLGLLGISAFILPPVLIVYAFFLILNKDIKQLNKRALYTFIFIVLASSLIQTGVFERENYVNMNVFQYISKFYEDGKTLHGGGVFGGIVSMPFILVFQPLGTIIILTALSLVNIILLTNISIANFVRSLRKSFASRHEKTSGRKKVSANSYDMDEIPYEIDNMYDDGEYSGQTKPKAKIIDFRIEKTSREAKAKTEQANKADLAQNTENMEPIDLIVEDLKKSSVKSQKREKENSESTEQIAANMGNIINIQDSSYGYEFPPIDLLNAGQSGEKAAKGNKNKAVEGAITLEETLKSFGVTAKVINISRGPTVTRYELQPSAGVKVSRIVNLADDIALNLAAQGIRIEAPIPGKAAIGIEVPNKEITTVQLRDVIESEEFRQHPSKLTFALGKDISGDCCVADIAKMPHMLIAGATGSGKSVCINCLIVSLLYKASPDEVKLLMIDPKVVELGVYNGIPHLLIPVVTDPKKAAGALNWAVQEMVNRYKLFADRSVRDLKSYNELLRANGEEGILPEIVIIIDELADLMMVAPNEVEDAICRLAQMARAAGMHLVIATQRPSVDVITGLIKANIPSRISFAVSSQVDSRTILDMAGAEKLLGKGDMLYYPIGKPKPVRIQGAFVSEKEVERVVEFLKSRGSANYNDDIIEEINNSSEPVEENFDDTDELLPQAIEMVVEAGQASVSLIQRKFKVGYARAARIIDQMEERGIIGGYEGSKPRQLLITKQQWKEMQMADTMRNKEQ